MSVRETAKTVLFQPPWNFLSVPREISVPERARAWVLSVPYESTTCYGAGTRDGPAAIVAASRQVEKYDREYGCEPVAKYGIHTVDPLAPLHRSHEAMLDAIETAVAGILSGSPAPEVLAILGGEHSISPGVARGIARARGAKDLVAVQIDAHADLRDEYDGSRLSHACAARRIVETCPIFQIGIRNISAEEERFRRGNKRVTTVFAEDSKEKKGVLKDLAKFVRGKSVYLTIDADGLDPSIMPSVGTPEPGGLSWERTIEIARVVCREAKRLAVFDFVELAPIPAVKGPDFLAALLVYRIFSFALLGASARRG